MKITAEEKHIKHEFKSGDVLKLLNLSNKEEEYIMIGTIKGKHSDRHCSIFLENGFVQMDFGYEYEIGTENAWEIAHVLTKIEGRSLMAHYSKEEWEMELKNKK